MSASSTAVPHSKTCDVPTMGLRFPPSSRIFVGKCRGVSLSSGPEECFLREGDGAEFCRYRRRNSHFPTWTICWPVLADFYTTWCGPCQFMVLILNEVRVALNNKIQFEKYPSIADKYRIEALPTFILFKDGIPFERFEGPPTANQFIHRIKDSLKVKR